MRKLLLLILFFLLIDSLSAQTWEQLNDPPFYKHHSNGFGFNGKGYVLEGVNGGDFASNELWEYTPETDSWIRLPDFPGEPREIAIGTPWNGKFYYGFGIGVQGNYLNDLWVFDPVDGSFTQLPSCPCIGRSHPALIAHNDLIYMGSGSAANGDLDDWWEFDIQTETWTQKPDIPGGDRHHPFQFGIDGYMYVGGGHVYNWLRFDPATDTWENINDIPEGRVAGSQFSYNGMGYLLGGDDAFHQHVPNEQTFMRYDNQLDEWEILPALPNGSRWAPSSFIIENELFFFGGISDLINNDASLWKFDLSSLDNPVATHEITDGVKEDLTVFPNPVDDLIRFQGVSEDNLIYDVSLLSAKGETIKQVENFNLTEQIDVTDLPSGFYIVVLENEDSILRTKVTIQ